MPRVLKKDSAERMLKAGVAELIDREDSAPMDRSGNSEAVENMVRGLAELAQELVKVQDGQRHVFDATMQSLQAIVLSLTAQMRAARDNPVVVSPDHGNTQELLQRITQNLEQLSVSGGDTASQWEFKVNERDMYGRIIRMTAKKVGE
jgi:hypothetical protein